MESPKGICILIPGTCVYVTLHGKWGFVDVIKLRISRWEIIPDSVNGPDVIPRVLIRERGRQKGHRERESLKEVTLLAFKIKKGATSQETQVA